MDIKELEKPSKAFENLNTKLPDNNKDDVLMSSPVIQNHKFKQVLPKAEKIQPEEIDEFAFPEDCIMRVDHFS